MDPVPRFDLDDPGALWFCARCGAAYARMPEECEECGGTEFLPRADAERLAARSAGARGEEAGEAVVLVGARSPLARARITALLEQAGIRFVVEDVPRAALPYQPEGPDARFVVAREDLPRARAVLEEWREEEARAALEEPWEVSVSGEDLLAEDTPGTGEGAEPGAAEASPSPPVVTGHRYAVPGSRRALAGACAVVFFSTLPLVHPTGIFLMDGRVEEGASLLLALGATWAGLLLALARPAAGVFVSVAAYGLLAFTAWRLGVGSPLSLAVGALGLAGAAVIAGAGSPTGPPAGFPPGSSAG